MIDYFTWIVNCLHFTTFSFSQVFQLIDLVNFRTERLNYEIKYRLQRIVEYKNKQVDHDDAREITAV